MEEIFPGKLTEINLIVTVDQAGKEFVKLRQTLDSYLNDHQQIIFARAEALFWSDSEKSLALVIDKTLVAFHSWAHALQSVFGTHGWDSGNLDVYNIEMPLIDLDIEISKTLQELRGTILVDANDENLKQLMKNIMDGTADYPGGQENVSHQTPEPLPPEKQTCPQMSSPVETFDVFLKSMGDDVVETKINIEDLTGMFFEDIDKFVDCVVNGNPSLILKSVDKSTADNAKSVLEGDGATVTIKPGE
jgi:ribosomal protein L7/L12